MNEREKVTRAEVDDMWNRFQGEVIAYAHDSTRRERLIQERLPELRSMIERCDNITGNRQDLFSRLSDHVSKLGLEATLTRPPLLYFENKILSQQITEELQPMQPFPSPEGKETPETLTPLPDDIIDIDPPLKEPKVKKRRPQDPKKK